MTSTKEPQKEPHKEPQIKVLNKIENEETPHVHGPSCSHHHHHEALRPIIRDAPKIGRNDPCLCGSQKKYKKCCGL